MMKKGARSGEAAPVIFTLSQGAGILGFSE